TWPMSPLCLDVFSSFGLIAGNRPRPTTPDRFQTEPLPEGRHDFRALCSPAAGAASLLSDRLGFSPALGGPKQAPVPSGIRIIDQTPIGWSATLRQFGLGGCEPR